MKRKAWPLLSLLLNVALLGAIVVLIQRPTARNDVKIDTLPVLAPQNLLVSNDQSLPPQPAANANEPDWRNWLAQVRATGVPDRVLAGLVASDFENRWQKRRRELQRRYDRGDLDEDSITRLVEQHDADQEKEMQAALGVDGFLKWDKDKMLSDLNADKIQLSSSETDSLYQLRKDLAQKENDLKQAHLNGEVDQSGFNALEVAVEKEYKEKLKLLLGDARYTALQSPQDGAQGQLVRTLKTLNASDTQFAAMLVAQKQSSDQRDALDRQLQESKDQSQPYEEQMRALDVARDAEYQRVLGTNGFDALQKSRDGDYQTLQRYAAAWQLSSDDIDYIYRAMQDSQKSVAEYRQQARALEAQGASVDWSKVDANVKEFTQQTQQGLRSYLGDDRFEKLGRNSIFEFASQ